MPTAVAVPIRPTFYHIFVVDIRYCFCCYKPYFKVSKNETDWILNKHLEEKSYKIPLNKSLKNIHNILHTIGLEDNKFKLNMIQNNKVVCSKSFHSLLSLFKHIIVIENSINDVIYTDNY